MDLVGACTGIGLFFYSENIERNVTRGRKLQISNWQLHKREGKLISYNVL
jgi:hypothetical protein